MIPLRNSLADAPRERANSGSFARPEQKQNYDQDEDPLGTLWKHGPMLTPRKYLPTFLSDGTGAKNGSSKTK